MMKKVFVTIFAILLMMTMFSVSSYAATYVAQVDGKKYTTLQEAIENAKDGSTVKVLTNISTKKHMYLLSSKKKKITIDFNNKSYKYTNYGFANSTAFLVNGGYHITVKNANIVSMEDIFYIDSDASLTIINGKFSGGITSWGKTVIKNGSFKIDKSNKGEDSCVISSDKGSLVIYNGTFTANKEGIAVIAAGEKAIINGGVFNSKSPKTLALYNSGEMVINSGTFTGVTDNTSEALHATVSNSGKMTINKATIKMSGAADDFKIGLLNSGEGKLTVNGINMRGMLYNYSDKSGWVKIKGGSITNKGSGAITQCENCGSTYISGGTIKADNSLCILIMENSTVKISGGKIASTNTTGFTIGVKGNLILTGGRVTTSGKNAICTQGDGKVRVSGSPYYTGKIVKG